MKLPYICYYPHLCNRCNKQCATCRLYTEGKLKPEYPVPMVVSNDNISEPLILYLDA